MNLLARPSEWSRSATSPAAGAAAAPTHHYFAFLSYSHRDAAMARWLHEELEKFRVPPHLIGRLTDNGVIPRRLAPIFRDLQELPASGDLGTEIRAAIAASQFLIVLCSPDAARSRWTSAEIEEFKRARPEGCAFAAVVAGEPFASDMPGREDEECLPESLRFKLDRRGRVTTRRAEPLAADLREPGPARRLGFLKLVAGMLGIGLDELIQREAVRRHRKLAMLAAASLGGMIVTSALAVAAVQGRDEARDQRRMAEGLVGFMLGDLRGKLEPLGRLDVLDSVAARALAYYEAQDKSGLSDESLAQRSKALTMMGEIAMTRGDLTAAMRLYREAFASSAEQLKRDPGNPQRLFDHAQNVFWIGYVDRQKGDVEGAQRAFQDYDRLARMMVAAEPTNTKWLLERTYSGNALGVLLLDRARYRDASLVFAEALRTSEGLVAIDPGNSIFQDRLVEALAWHADARELAGSLGEALALRERQIAYMRELQLGRADDAMLKRKTMTAHRVIGRLYASRGQTPRALASLQTAAEIAREMLRTDPANTEWAQFASHIMFDQAELQLASGQPDLAVQPVSAGCDIARRLAARDSTVVEWRAVLPGRCLSTRAELALAHGSPGGARSLAEQLVQLLRREAGRQDSAQMRFALAEAELRSGKVAERLGDEKAAEASWRAANAAWPELGEMTPRETAVRADLLRRLGLHAESRGLTEKLAAIGYRHPVYVSVRSDSGQGNRG